MKLDEMWNGYYGTDAWRDYHPDPKEIEEENWKALVKVIKNGYKNKPPTPAAVHALDEIKTDPHLAYRFTKEELIGRWKAAEPYIAKNLNMSFLYAKNIIKGRFPEAEKYHSANKDWMFRYKRDVIDFYKIPTALKQDLRYKD